MKKAFLATAMLCLFVSAANANVQNMVKAEARRQGVPVHLALSVAKHESNFRCSAVGRHGERGVMQIKPRTAKGLGYRGSASGLNHCQTGIKYGMMYLSLAYKKARGNMQLAATYYNQGLGTKRKNSRYAQKVVGR